MDGIPSILRGGQDRGAGAPAAGQGIGVEIALPSGRQTIRSTRFRCADFVFAIPQITSDGDDSGFAAGSPDEPFYVVWVACEDSSFLPKGGRHHDRVNDIRRFGHA